MASKIVIRTMLIAALVVTAHTIKPFSFGNVTLQVLGTAHSLSFAMPEAAAERIEYAHYLAQTYGKGFFDDDAASVWAKQNFLGSEFVALASSVDPNENAEIKDVKSADQSKKPAQKRPVKRIKRDENRDEDSGCSKSNEIAKLPEAKMLKAIALVSSVNLTAYQPEMVALTQHSRRLPNLPGFKIEWALAPKPAATSLCRDAVITTAEIVEATVEIVIGPEEEEENIVAEPEQIVPLISTGRVSGIPECLRIP